MSVLALVAWLFVLAGAVSVLAWLASPAHNTYITLRHQPEWRFCTYDFGDPSAGYPVDRPGSRELVRAGYYARPPFDADGIPVVDYRWIRSPDMPQGRFHNPTNVAQYALWGCYLPYLSTGDFGLKEDFLRQAEWLLAAQNPDGSYPSGFRVESRGLAHGWLSALHQGQATSVLVRAYLQTDDSRFLDGATRATRALLTPCADGGVLSVDDTGTWLEEYPEEPPSHVLNGLVFAWYGLWDFNAVVDDEAARDIAAQVAETIARNIDRYSAADGVRYELKRSLLADRSGYLPLQIEQLKSLAAMTGAARLSLVASDWQQQWRGPRRYSIPGASARAAISSVAFRVAQVTHRWRRNREADSR